ncbi:MAG: MarR family transcriptional regulator [Bacteroidota bacterium]
MLMKLEDSIKQKKFKSEYEKLAINILYSSSWLSQLHVEVLKPYNISWQQFNILRILRGMNPEPATVKLLTERMIDKMSNASRLVEKLKQKGLVERRSCANDRRRVDIGITQAGLQLINEASKHMEEGLHKYLKSLEVSEASELNELLDKMRG